MENKTIFLRDFSSGASAKIKENKNGSAILTVSIAGSRYLKKEYKNVKSAKSAWYRLCN